MKQWYASWKTEINNYWNQQNNYGMERIKVSIYAQDRASLKASLVGIGVQRFACFLVMSARRIRSLIRVSGRLATQSSCFMFALEISQILVLKWVWASKLLFEDLQMISFSPLRGLLSENHRWECCLVHYVMLFADYL